MVILRLLGQVEVIVDGTVFGPATSQQRLVLAALAVDAGRVVTRDTMTDRVWENAPPRHLAPAVYAHVSRIRALLTGAGARAPGGGPARVGQHGGGYRLDIEPDAVDLHRFRRLVARSRTEPRPEPMLAKALKLWHGEPLAGLHGAWAAQVRAGWEQERIDAAVAWAGAALAAGQPDDVVAVLRPLLAAHPSVEPLTGALMRALVALGRGAEALDLYAAARRHLGEELGAIPGPALQALHRSVLRGATTRPSTPVPSDAAARQPTPDLPVPAQLPADIPGFVGRGAELASLSAQLTRSPHDHGALPVMVIAGRPGIGKTALAVHWSHGAAGSFPNGQLYCDLGAGTRPIPPGEALGSLLTALGVPPDRMPAGPADRAALFRSLTADRRLLLLLDNAARSDQVFPLLPGSATCLVLVTSRSPLPTLLAEAAAGLVELGPLTAGEAIDLLGRRLGAERVTAESVPAGRIVAASGGLPRTLAVAAAHCQSAGSSLYTVAAQLAGVAAAGRRIPRPFPGGTSCWHPS